MTYRSTLQKWFFSLTLISGSMGLPCAVSAQEFRTDSIVVVEASGENASSAREVAIAKGQIEGFKLLIQRVAPGDAEAIISTTPDSRMISAAKGFEVLDEQMSATTYRAKMKIQYDPDMINEILRSPDTQAAASLKTNVLVLPVLRMGSTLQLWEQDNKWRDIFNSVGLEVGRGVIIMPYGDQKDKELADPFTASTAAYDRLMPLATRYGADQIVIAEAVPVIEGATHSLTVNVRQLTPTGGEASSETYTPTGDETQEMLMVKAARAIASGLKGQNTAGYSNTSVAGGKSVMLLASIKDISEWLELRKRLLNMSIVEKLELKALSVGQVDVVVHYRGDASLLAKYMLAHNMGVNPGPQYWTVSLQQK